MAHVLWFTHDILRNAKDYTVTHHVLLSRMVPLRCCRHHLLGSCGLLRLSESVVSGGRMLLIDCGDVVACRAQNIQRLNAVDADNSIALLVVRPGWQTNQRLLRHTLSVDLLSRGSLLDLWVTQVVRVETAFLLHVPVHIRWLTAWLLMLLNLLLMLLLLLLLVLEVLQGGLHLQSFLQVVERGVFEATVADKVVQLVPGLDYIQVQSIVEPNYILFLQDAYISIYIQVL